MINLQGIMCRVIYVQYYDAMTIIVTYIWQGNMRGERDTLAAPTVSWLFSEEFIPVNRPEVRTPQGLAGEWLTFCFLMYKATKTHTLAWRLEVSQREMKAHDMCMTSPLPLSHTAYKHYMFPSFFIWTQLWWQRLHRNWDQSFVYIST